MRKIYPCAFPQKCYVQISDLSKLTSDLTFVYSMRQGGNNVLDELLITGGWWWTSSSFSKVVDKGKETNIYPVFPLQLIQLVNKQIVAMKKFLFKEEFQLVNERIRLWSFCILHELMDLGHYGYK